MHICPKITPQDAFRLLGPFELCQKVPLAPAAGRGGKAKAWATQDLLSSEAPELVRAPRDDINIRILQIMMSGPLSIGPWKQNVRSLCLCGLLARSLGAFEPGSFYGLVSVLMSVFGMI